MSKSAIYTANTSAQTVAVNDVIPVGITSRRFGCNIRQDGNTITLLGQGYYQCDPCLLHWPPRRREP